MIELDHPDRKGGRDPNIRAVSAGSTITGFHVHEIVFDDLVTDENFESEALRREVSKCFVNCSKIASTGAKMKAVGTRYGQNDEYSKWLEMEVPEFDEEGNEVGHKKLWDVFERAVEDSPNRTGDGNFLWPKMHIPDVGTFGMDQTELAKKKAMLTYNGDLAGFFGQFYNDPNDESMHRIDSSCFQYIDPKFLRYENGAWFYGQKQLKITVAADLAFSSGQGLARKKRDFTALCVIGRDSDSYIYVLDLDRFQTDKLEVYYDRILELQDKWQFREIYIETNNGGKLVKSYIEDTVRKTGGSLVVHGVAHTSHQGKKEERIAQAVEPRYRNKEVFHVRSGYTKYLEEELRLPKPKNDDLKDVLALAIEKSKGVLGKGIRTTGQRNVVPLSRFGGVRRRA
jgi:phage terminase large subunit-like protein